MASSSGGLARRLRTVEDEVRAWSRLRAQVGTRAATAIRLRTLLDAAPAEELARLQEDLAAARVSAAEAHARLDLAFELVETVFPVLQRVGDVEVEAGRLWARLELLGGLHATAAEVALDPPSVHPLISVVLPTHDRRVLLEEAVASVRAQSYANWELVVVADRCHDDTVTWLEGQAAEEPRLRWTTCDAGRQAVACNRGLELATGEAVAYLDDDNLMHPDWLSTVAWALEEYAGTDVFYGALAVDRPDRLGGLGGGGSLPRLHLEPFDRARLAEENYVDQSCLVHRAGLAGARFDEELTRFLDWDLFGRLVADRTPLAVPAVACVYRTAADEARLSLDTADHPDLERVRTRLRRLLAAAPGDADGTTG